MLNKTMNSNKLLDEYKKLDFDDIKFLPQTQVLEVFYRYALISICQTSYISSITRIETTI